MMYSCLDSEVRHSWVKDWGKSPGGKFGVNWRDVDHIIIDDTLYGGPFGDDFNAGLA